MSPFPVASRAMKVPLQALGSQSLLSAPLSCGQQHGAWVSGCVGGAAPHGGKGAGGSVAPAVHTRLRCRAGSRAFRSAGLRPGVGGWALLPDPPQASENSAPGRFRAESLCPVIKTSSGTDEGDAGRRQRHLPDGTELPRRQQAEPTTLPPKSWAHSLRRPPPPPILTPEKNQVSITGTRSPIKHTQVENVKIKERRTPL